MCTYAVFTPDTCSPYTSCIHLYSLLPSTYVLYPQQNCHHGYMYPLVSASRTLLRTCVRQHVSGYKLLIRDSCIWLHVSGVNVALCVYCINLDVNGQTYLLSVHCICSSGVIMHQAAFQVCRSSGFFIVLLCTQF